MAIEIIDNTRSDSKIILPPNGIPFSNDPEHLRLLNLPTYFSLHELALDLGSRVTGKNEQATWRGHLQLPPHFSTITPHPIAHTYTGFMERGYVNLTMANLPAIAMTHPVNAYESSRVIGTAHVVHSEKPWGNTFSDITSSAQNALHVRYQFAENGTAIVNGIMSAQGVTKNREEFWQRLNLHTMVEFPENGSMKITDEPIGPVQIMALAQYIVDPTPL